MQVVYLMHRFGGDAANLDKAEHWCAVLSRHFDAVFIAPWTAFCRHMPNTGSSLELGIRMDFAIIDRCDAAIAVGGTWSPGMRREREHCRETLASVIDMTRFVTPEEFLADQNSMDLLGSIFKLRRAAT